MRYQIARQNIFSPPDVYLYCCHLFTMLDRNSLIYNTRAFYQPLSCELFTRFIKRLSQDLNNSVLFAHVYTRKITYNSCSIYGKEMYHTQYKMYACMLRNHRRLFATLISFWLFVSQLYDSFEITWLYLFCGWRVGR